MYSGYKLIVYIYIFIISSSNSIHLYNSMVVISFLICMCLYTTTRMIYVRSLCFSPVGGAELVVAPTPVLLFVFSCFCLPRELK